MSCIVKYWQNELSLAKQTVLANARVPLMVGTTNHRLVGRGKGSDMKLAHESFLIG